MATAGAVAVGPVGPAAPRRLRVLARRHPVATFLVRRVLAGIATLLVASLLVFLATATLSGDVANAALGQRASPEALADLRAKLGLERPLPERYLDWLGGLVTGDLGDSALKIGQGAEDAPITDAIKTPLRNSLVLAALVALVMLPLSLAIGVFLGLRAGRPVDHAVTVASLGLIAMPEFVLASLFVLVFFTWLDWLPPVALFPEADSPLSHLDVLVLPVLTLTTILTAVSVRMIRAGVIEVIGRPYVAMARLNGLPERRVVLGAVLRNAMATSVQVLVQSLQYLLGGIIIIEAVFSYPGLGKLLVDAVTNRDIPSVQAVAMLIGAIAIALNIIADLIVILLVPKLRTTLS